MEKKIIYRKACQESHPYLGFVTTLLETKG